MDFNHPHTAGFWRELGLVCRELLFHNAQNLVLEFSYKSWIVHQSPSPHYHAHVHVRWDNYGAVLSRLASKHGSMLKRQVNNVIKQQYEGDVCVEIPIFSALDFFGYCAGMCTRSKLRIFSMVSGWFASLSGFVFRLAPTLDHGTRYSLRTSVDNAAKVQDLLTRTPLGVVEAMQSLLLKPANHEARLLTEATILESSAASL
jgi:hypothetical protein